MLSAAFMLLPAVDMAYMGGKRREEDGGGGGVLVSRGMYTRVLFGSRRELKL